MTVSPKAATNKKWTSNKNYRNNFDSIFGKKEEIEEEKEENEKED